ncbi:MAG: hypothetical protein QHH27_02035 [Clostridia bacterium]|jgi:hypothetical protein|nr:hypothetical protein [Clostridia bacterium]MDH7572314.1 hypothetical protein [Clostridia bacterium]
MAVLQEELQTSARLLTVWRSMRFRLLVEGILVGFVAGLVAVAFRLITETEVEAIAQEFFCASKTWCFR